MKIWIYFIFVWKLILKHVNKRLKKQGFIIDHSLSLIFTYIKFFSKIHFLKYRSTLFFMLSNLSELQMPLPSLPLPF